MAAPQLQIDTLQRIENPEARAPGFRPNRWSVPLGQTSSSIPLQRRSAPAVVQADLPRLHVVAMLEYIAVDVGRLECAEIHIEVFALYVPVRQDGVFESGADGPAPFGVAHLA